MTALGLAKVLWDKVKELERAHRKLEELHSLDTRVGGIEERVAILEKEMKEFRTNYLSRFEGVHKALGEVKLDIVKEIGSLKIMLVGRTEGSF
jgi:DNA repair exonuclease SbcCD ATPase subunit